MSEEPGGKRGRWGAPPSADPSGGASAIPPPPGMGFPSAGHKVNVPPPPKLPSDVVNVPPPPPSGRREGDAPTGGAYGRPSAGDGNPFGGSGGGDGNPFGGSGGGKSPFIGGGGAYQMTPETAKSLAERAASAIRRTLGLVGAAGADPTQYPGVPHGWGAGMTEAQLQAAYHQHTRQSRRLYVGNIPKGVSDLAVTKFFNDAMLASGAAVNPSAGDPVITTQMNPEKGFAFVEFLAMEDAESALMFNDVPFENVKLAVRRPKDYENALNPLVVKRGGVDSQAAASAISNARDKQALGGMVELPVGVVLDPKLNTEISLQAPPPIATEWGRVSRRVPDSKNKLYAGGFDPLHSETQVRQVLQAVGQLKSFAPMPDAHGKFTGHVFFEFVDPRLTLIAVEALTGVSIAAGVCPVTRKNTKRRLVCRLANDGAVAKKKVAADVFSTSEPPSFTYQVPPSAAALLGEAAAAGVGDGTDTQGVTTDETCVLWVYNAIVAEHGAKHEQGEVEKCVRLKAASETEWDEACVSSRQIGGDCKIELTFEHGGDQSQQRGAGRSPQDAAAQCAGKLHGRKFEGRELWVRFVPA